MTKKLTTLLSKGKLTGEEVGQLMIKDLVISYEDALKNPEVRNGNREAKSLLTDAQRQAMVDGLTSKEDIRTYNDYRALYEYLLKGGTLVGLHYKEAEVAVWRLMHLISLLKNAEEEYSYSRYEPTIMTQKQFDKLKEDTINGILANTDSVEGIVISALQKYIDEYQEGKKTPYNKYFNKYKKEPITNPRILANYWEEGEGGYYLTPDGRKSSEVPQEEWQAYLEENPQDGDRKIQWIVDSTAPEDATKLDVLKYVSGFYYSEETDSKKTFFELKKDYPDLYKAIIADLSTMKGLEIIKDTPEKKYFDTKLIKWKDLIDNDTLGYKQYVDKPFIDGHFSIAVLQQFNFGNGKIDEEGNYKPPEWRNRHRAESFLDSFKDIIISEYEFINYNIKEALIIKETFELIGDFINIKEINTLIGEIAYISTINYINEITQDIIDSLVRIGMYEDERPAEELKVELKEIFTHIDIEALRPKKQNINKAKELIKDFSIFKGNMESVYSVLRGVE